MARGPIAKGRGPSLRGPTSLLTRRRAGGAVAPPAFPAEVTTPIDGAPDLLAQAMSRYTSRHQGKPKLAAWTAAAIAPLQAIANTLVQISRLSDPSQAGGVNLDATAQLVGQLRAMPNGSQLGDPALRLAIQARIIRNRSRGTGPDVLAVMAAIFPGAEVRFVDLGSMAIQVAVGRRPSNDEAALVTLAELIPRPAGVRILPTWYVVGGFFGFDDTPGALNWGEDASSSPGYAEAF